MPLRMILDGGAVAPEDVALVGARNLDPPELEYLAASPLHAGDEAIERAVAGADGVYVALDADSVEPGELACFMPEPDGIHLDELERLLREVAARIPVAGLGFSGLLPDRANEPKLARLAAALGL
jgi:arginase